MVKGSHSGGQWGEQKSARRHTPWHKPKMAPHNILKRLNGMV